MLQPSIPWSYSDTDFPLFHIVAAWEWPGSGLEMTWQWPGSGLAMAWQWPGNGLEMAWKWPGSGLAMAWQWPGNGLEMAWKWPGNGLEMATLMDESVSGCRVGSGGTEKAKTLFTGRQCVINAGMNEIY